MRRIAYIQYTNPAGYPPLEHSSRLLADEGWNVLFLGMGVDGVQSLRFPPRQRITVRQLSPCPAGWRQKLHYIGFVIWVAFWTLASRSSWVYASDPLSCVPGLLLSFIPGIRVIYHEHDSPPVNRGRSDGHPSRFIQFALCARRRLAGRAALCVLPNERRVQRFTEDVRRPVHAVCVWNCPTRNEANPSQPSSLGGDLWVAYHGSIVPSRLPRTVIEALTLLPERVKLRVIGYETIGHKGYVTELRALADKFGVARRVEFLGAVPTRTELLEYCRQSHVGLALMPMVTQDPNEQTMTGASNKPFDYLACGLALLVSDLPDWQAFYVEPGYALAVDPDDPKSIASTLRWLLEHPAELREMGGRGRKQILAEWHYEKQFLPVIQHLTERRTWDMVPAKKPGVSNPTAYSRQ